MSSSLRIILIYMLAASVIGFFAMGIDKAKARVGAWRISEKTLFGITLLGGGAGVWLGMQMFHHKTRHWYFKYGVPIIFLVELVGVFWLLK